MHNRLEDDDHPISVEEYVLGRKMQNHLEDDDIGEEDDDTTFVGTHGPKCSYSVLVFFVLYVILIERQERCTWL